MNFRKEQVQPLQNILYQNCAKPNFSTENTPGHCTIKVLKQQWHERNVLGCPPSSIQIDI
jgi:hypothetical protein